MLIDELRKYESENQFSNEIYVKCLECETIKSKLYTETSVKEAEEICLNCTKVSRDDIKVRRLRNHWS